MADILVWVNSQTCGSQCAGYVQASAAGLEVHMFTKMQPAMDYITKDSQKNKPRITCVISSVCTCGSFRIGDHVKKVYSNTTCTPLLAMLTSSAKKVEALEHGFTIFAFQKSHQVLMEEVVRALKQKSKSSWDVVAEFGENLISGDKHEKSTEILQDKYVGIYFSAHWCPPCRGFTPKLAEAYTKELKNKGLEIIFVSSDNNDSSFQSYFSEMPWTAVKFSDQTRIEALRDKHGLTGIPALVILNKDGTTMTRDGRSKVADSLKDFPNWS